MIDINMLVRMFHMEHIEISSGVAGLFDLYAQLLVEWNQKMNLTAIVEPLEIVEKHFLDSVLILKYCDIPEEATVIDVGTGAGFPGIPLKLVRNDIHLTLVDSLNKRVNFLKEIAFQLGFSANFIHSRAEDCAKLANLREKFDIATARAVAPLPILCEYCLPFLKIGGSFIALKGPNDEIDNSKSAIKLLGGEINNIFHYCLPCLDERTVIVVKKISHTPPKYPRNSAVIKKKSL